jgi:hypothetical protein
MALPKFFLSNASYFIASGFTEDELDVFRKILDVEGIRLLVPEDGDQITTILTKARHIEGMFLKSPPFGANADWIKVAETKNFDVAVFGEASAWNGTKAIILEGPVQSAGVRAHLNQALHRKIPLKMDELAIHAGNTIAKVILPDVPTSFKVISAIPASFKPDILVSLDTTTPPFIGRAVLQIQSDLVKMDFNALAEASKEFTNQFLGIVNQHLSKLGFSPSIALPFLFTKDEVVSVVRSGPFLPRITLKDQTGSMVVNVGFLHEEGNGVINLSGLTVGEDDGDVDFF